MILSAVSNEIPRILVKFTKSGGPSLITPGVGKMLG